MVDNTYRWIRSLGFHNQNESSLSQPATEVMIPFIEKEIV
jgi:hypothetical protein